MSLEPPVSPDEPPDPAGSFDDPDPGAEMSLAVRRDGALLDSDSLDDFDSDALDSDDFGSDALDSDDFDSEPFDSDAFESDPPFESGLESEPLESEPFGSEVAFESDDSLGPALASADTGSWSLSRSAGRVPSGR